MSAGWVAGSVRARALAQRRVGRAGARRIAASGSLDSALRELTGTGYGGNAHPGLEVAEAQHGVAATVLWNLRVLAGWLPRDGVAMLRTLAAWFELANVDEMLAVRGGPAFDPGALATAWPRLRAAGPSCRRHRDDPIRPICCCAGTTTVSRATRSPPRMRSSAHSAGCRAIRPSHCSLVRPIVQPRPATRSSRRSDRGHTGTRRTAGFALSNAPDMACWTVHMAVISASNLRT